MSHTATNWAVKQRGIPPAAKIVLWHLADRHNPDRGCFPSQDRLAEDCELSRRSLNDQLQRLEDAGLIRRQKRIDPVTRRQLNTRYILRFEAEFDQYDDGAGGDGTGGASRASAGHATAARVQNLHTDQENQSQERPIHSCDGEQDGNVEVVRVQNLHTDQDGQSDAEDLDAGGGEQEENISASRVQNLHTGAVCKSTSEPCANFVESRVQNLHTNPVRGTSKRTLCSAEGETHTNFDFDDVLDRFNRAYPRLGDQDLTRDALSAAIADGVDPELIVRAAWAYAAEQKGNSRQYIAYSENWIARKGWEKVSASQMPETARPDEVNALLAETIKGGKPWLCRHITAMKARALVSAGLVSIDDCRKVGVL